MNTPDHSAENRVAKKHEYVSRSVAGETLLLPVKSGVASLESIYTLNEVAGTIWELIDGQRSADAIAVELARRFEVSVEEAARDVHEFLADLTEAGLVSGFSPPISSPDPSPDPASKSSGVPR